MPPLWFVAWEKQGGHRGGIKAGEPAENVGSPPMTPMTPMPPGGEARDGGEEWETTL